MKILITGIHGFVGTNLVEALSPQFAIYGVSNSPAEMKGVKGLWNWGELHLLPEMDVVIHLAGKAHDTKKQVEAQLYFDTNVGLTQQIYDWFVHSSAQQFIFFSSVKAAADSVEGILTEEAPPTPKGAYGESKRRAEQYLLNKLPQDKGVIILRPCMVHGPGNKGNLNLLYALLKKGVPWPLGSYENRRSFLSIGNLVFVISQLLRTPRIATGIYQVADDEPLSTNQLIQIMCGTLKQQATIWKLPPLLVNGMAKVGTLLGLPLNQERLHKLTESYVVSNRKIKQALNIPQMPIEARAGIIRTMNSFLK